MSEIETLALAAAYPRALPFGDAIDKALRIHDAQAKRIAELEEGW